MIHEVIIVGTGPSGVASAMGFAENGIIPLILDVGYEPAENKRLEQNFFDFRKSNDSFNMMIGNNYEGLHNVINEKTIFPKLISPFMQFVVKDAEKLSPIDENGFMVTQSFAMGGLANAWGAGLYRCVDDELKNIPFKPSELSPYYDKLTKEIGISGDDDDLTPFFGSTENLLTPLKLSKKAEKLYLKYKKKKTELNAKGMYIGRPRLGVLSQNYYNRRKCDYHNLELWLPNLPYIYNPSFTLTELIKNNKALYEKSVLVKSWDREGKVIIVHGENIRDGVPVSFKCKRLVLAAGTINSAKIVLKSKKDFKAKLPLYDNIHVQVPLIFPSFVGSKLETEAFGLTNLNAVFDFRRLNLRLQGSILELTFPARSIFYEMFPFSAKDNLAFTRTFLPSLLVMLLYFPSSSENAGHVTLRSDDLLETYGLPCKINRNVIKKVTNTFLGLGVLTHHLLARYKPMGYTIHYAGTLPMVQNPRHNYQCNALGELHREPGIFIVDGSLFSYIPAKNITFTLMANAMRIADHISKEIKT
ncbi:hypothetical protein BMS3Abin15_01146 [bacterium BMS3Abin15]|nr:hypothetical protein BMS3Abin15_01146 [bacterium BMS3Abin15]